MNLSRTEQQAINDIATQIMDYLPGNVPTYGDTSLSFQGIANRMDLGSLWKADSKRQSIINLLEATYANFRYQFSPLIISILDKALEIRRRSTDKNITVDDLKRLERHLLRLGVRVGQFSDPSYLAHFATGTEAKPAQELPLSSIIAAKATTQNLRPIQPPVESKLSGGFAKPSPSAEELMRKLRADLVALNTVAENMQGYAFGTFLNKLFLASGFKIKHPLNTLATNIVGVIEADNKTFMLEATWNRLITGDQLRDLQRKLQEKELCSHALIVSYGGFTGDAVGMSFAGGKRIVAADGRDLFLLLDSAISLNQMLQMKTEYSEKHGRPFVSIQELIPSVKNP